MSLWSLLPLLFGILLVPTTVRHLLTSLLRIDPKYGSRMWENTNSLVSSQRTKVPALGFNTWNAYACNINEDILRETAILMKSLGLQEAGYEYVNIDDCWLTNQRDVKGELQYDETKFPSGLLNLTDFLHNLGFKAGIYEDQGTETCAGFAGSLGNELTDAYSFLEWGFDYLKIDNCNGGSFQGTNAERFQRWTDAINTITKQEGATFVYSLVEWQSFDAWTWAPALANSWRIYDDISPNWSRIVQILNNASFIGQYTNHYAHNDLDMLEIGNGVLTLAEQRSHFTAWALNKSPLLIGTNLSAISPESVEILNNPEILAINQDQFVGKPLVPFFWGKNPDHTWDPTFPAQYWSGYYGKDQQTAIMYINFNSETVDLNFTFSLSPHLEPNAKYAVRDLWAHQDLGEFSGFFFGRNVASHDVRAYLFTKCD